MRHDHYLSCSHDESRTNSSVFPLNTHIAYVVEERFASNPEEVNYAWSFDTKQEAQTALLGLMDRFPDRLYSAYILM